MLKKLTLLEKQNYRAIVLISGSRKYSDYNTVCRAIGIAIQDLAKKGFKEIVFIQGGAPGADKHAIEFINVSEKSVFAMTGVKIRYVTFLPNWDDYGKAAGPIRNEEMVKTNPDHALIFLQKGEPNKGTLGVVKMLKRANIPFTPYGAVELLDRVA